MDLNDAVARVTATLRAELPALRKMDLAADTPLLSAGLLDSFAIVTLLAELEKAFSVQLDVATLELEQLESPSTIARLCLDAAIAGRGGARG